MKLENILFVKEVVLTFGWNSLQSVISLLIGLH